MLSQATLVDSRICLAQGEESPALAGGVCQHWWVYPNESEGIYSKCLARANVAGDLVIGSGDDTCLVGVRYGRFTITRQIADDVVSIFDQRMLVCL